MAFVIKSKKVFHQKIGETNDIGPGEYISQTVLKNVSPSKAPFLVKEIKGSSNDMNDNPGPGSYYKDVSQIKYLKNINKNMLDHQNDHDQVLVSKDNNMILKVRASIERLGFMKKDKRFKYDEKEKCIPGPGFYFPELTPHIQMFNKAKPQANREIKKIKNFISLRNETSVPSIPINGNYGFELSSNGKLIKKVNPDLYRTFTGEKGDSVGPGSYDLDFPKNWHNTGTKWSKLKAERIKYLNNSIEKVKQNNTLKDRQFRITLNTTGCSDTRSLIRTKKSLTNCKIIKGSTKNILSNNLLRTLNQSKSQDEIYHRLPYNGNESMQANYPGPGYYFDTDKLSSLKVKTCPESSQFFGSKNERFLCQRQQNNIGPASYFNSNEDKKMKKEFVFRSTKTLTAFSSNVKRFNKSDDDIENPGPGHYDPSDINAKNKKSSDKSIFGSTEKRFSQFSKKIKKDFDTPGPGAYSASIENPKTAELLMNWKGMMTSVDKTRIQNNKTVIRSISCRALPLNNNPAVGQYNPDILYTINYKIQKKANKFLSKSIAFDRGESKERDKENPPSIKNKVAPGYYQIEKKKVKNQIHPPFFQSDKRNLGNIIRGKVVGPGDYHSDSYFSWNKKTFNINYV